MMENKDKKKSIKEFKNIYKLIKIQFSQQGVDNGVD